MWYTTRWSKQNWCLGEPEALLKNAIKNLYNNFGATEADDTMKAIYGVNIPLLLSMAWLVEAGPIGERPAIALNIVNYANAKTSPHKWHNKMASIIPCCKVIDVISKYDSTVVIINKRKSFSTNSLKNKKDLKHSIISSHTRYQVCFNFHNLYTLHSVKKIVSTFHLARQEFDQHLLY
jgi:hypothetical protein